MDKYQESVLNSKIVVVKFHELCKGFRSPVCTGRTEVNFRRKESSIRFIKFLNQMSNLFKESKCDRETFEKEIIRLNYLGLEIFWYLQICNVMPLNQLISAHETNGSKIVIENIGQDLIQMYFKCSSGNSQYTKEIFQDFINVIFSSATDHDGSLYNCFTSLIILQLKKSQDFDVIPIIELLNSQIENKSLVKVFYNNILKFFLIDDDKKSSVKDAFVIQQSVQDRNLKQDHISKLFTSTFKCFDSGEILKLLNDIFSENANWEYLLIFISTYGSTYEDGYANLKNTVNNLIEGSFQKLNLNKLSYAFIIARQCCFSRVSHFPGYLQWFSSTFSSESSRPINSKQNCEFFFKFLNDLVECDLPYYLRIHINRVPHVPIECQPILSDYIKLVKTRFCDLNESIELGFFENTSEKSSAEFDVDHALESFKTNEEIPHCILEASMFNRNYYEKKFLPELMSKFESKNSTRHKFVVKLHSLGKIANSVFLNYKHLNCIL